MNPTDDEVATAEIPLLRPSPRPRSPAGTTVEQHPERVDPGVDAGADPDADLFEDESWDRPRRTNRLTTVLLVGLLIVAGFIGGVAVQKQHDAGLFPGTGAATARNRAGSTGGTGAGGSRTGNRADDRAGSARDTAGPAAPGDQQPPIVTGTVGTIAGDAVTVTDTGGAPVTVLVPQTATVTTSGLTGLTAGAQVSVHGTKGADGTVTATAITSRAAGG